MMASLDMDGLRAFVAIVDSMSFSRAGEAIGRSQSAISLRLRRLEYSLGVSLLVRRQGRVTELTREGEKLLGYARQIIALNDSALRDISGHSALPRLRVGMTADFLDMGLHQALNHVRPLAGDAEVEMESDVSERLRLRCAAGDLDVVFYKRDGAADGGVDLITLPLVWVASAIVASGNGGAVPLVCFPEGCTYRKTMIAVLRRAGIAHHLAFTTPALDTLRKAVAEGVGVTALPAALVQGDSRLAILDHLPALGSVTLAMMLAPGSNVVVRRVAEVLGDHLAAQHRA